MQKLSSALRLSPTQVNQLRADKYDDSTRQGLAEIFLTSSPYRQAGRLSALAELEGRKAPLALRNPKTYRALMMLSGAAMGSIPGIVSMLGANPQSTAEAAQSFSNARNTLAIGSAAGGLGGALLSAALMHRAKKREQERGPHQRVNNALLAGNPLASGVSGIHQAGRADVMAALQGEPVEEMNDRAMTGLDFAKHVPILGLPASILSAIGSGGHFINAQKRIAPAQYDFLPTIPQAQ